MEVEAGGKAKMAIGGPFHFEFTHAVEGGKLTVAPYGIKLMGRGGEEYVSYRWRGAPKVKITSGSAVLASGGMGFS